MILRLKRVIWQKPGGNLRLIALLTGRRQSRLMLLLAGLRRRVGRLIAAVDQLLALELHLLDLEIGVAILVPVFVLNVVVLGPQLHIGKLGLRVHLISLRRDQIGLALGIRLGRRRAVRRHQRLRVAHAEDAENPFQHDTDLEKLGVRRRDLIQRLGAHDALQLGRRIRVGARDQIIVVQRF